MVTVFIVYKQQVQQLSDFVVWRCGIKQFTCEGRPEEGHLAVEHCLNKSNIIHADMKIGNDDDDDNLALKCLM